MAWICSPSANNCIIRFYSIADELKVLNEFIFTYIANLSPGIWTMIIVIGLTSFVLALLLSVRTTIKRSGSLHG